MSADDLQDALGRMAKDDPTFTVREDAETGQTVISGMGELHLDIIAERLRRDWNVNVKVGKPRVSYKQTITARAKGTGTYEVEAGERRLFGEVTVEVEPFEKAPGGLAVEVAVDPEVIPEPFHDAIEEGVRSKATAVGEWGDQLIDVKVRVVGGRCDPDESNEAAFAAAGSRALEAALEEAGLATLEPVMTLTVDAPEEFVGNVQQDLQMRRAEILRSDVVRDRRRIVAAVPLAEVFGYANDVRSKTQGRADFTLEPRDYAVMPEGMRPSLF